MTFALSGGELTAAHDDVDQPDLVDGARPGGMPLESYMLAKQALLTHPGNPIFPKVIARLEEEFSFLPDLLAQRLRIIFLLRQHPPQLSSNADVLGGLALTIYPVERPSSKNNAVALASGGIMGSLSMPFLLAGNRVVASDTLLAPGMMIDTATVTGDMVRAARLEFLNLLCRCAGYGCVRSYLHSMAPAYLADPVPYQKIVYEGPVPPMMYRDAPANTTRAQDLFPARIVSNHGELLKQYQALVGDRIAPSIHDWFQAA